MPIPELRSFLAGRWRAGIGAERILRDAASGEPIARLRSGGRDLGAALAWGRNRGGAGLRGVTFRERGAMVAALAAALHDHRGEPLRFARTYGATAADARRDVDGGLHTLGCYGKPGSRKLPRAAYLADGEVEPLSRKGGFAGRHLLVPRRGIAVQINAYNFPAGGRSRSWGRRCSPEFRASSSRRPGQRSSPAGWSNASSGPVSFPQGSLQLLLGSAGDLLDHLDSQDAVLFTGSAETGRKIRSHPRLVEASVRVNVEADSLKAAILGPEGTPALRCGRPSSARFAAR